MSIGKYVIKNEDCFKTMDALSPKSIDLIIADPPYEDFLFLTKSDKYTFNIPYTDERSTRKDLGFNGKPRSNTHKRVSNVWIDIAEASQSSIERCDHPTVKAQKLCDRIIQTHSNKQDLIYVPFAGSGSEIISAVKNDRKVIASEISKKYVDLAQGRISQLLKSYDIDI